MSLSQSQVKDKLRKPEPEQRPRMPGSVLAAALLFAFAIWVPLLIVPPMEQVLRQEFSLTFAQSSLLFNAPIFTMVLVAIPAGLIADRIGIKKAAGIGAIVIVLGTVLRGFATNFNALLVFTLIYGLGLGWAFPNIPKLVTQWVGRERAHGTTAVLTAAILASAGISLAITMPVVYAYTQSVQEVFLIFSSVPIASTVIWWLFIKEPPNIRRTTVSALQKVAKNRTLWIVSGLFFLHNYFLYTWAGWVVTYLIDQGIPLGQAGLITSVLFWAAVPMALFIPRLSRRLGTRKPFLWMPSIILALLSWLILDINLLTSWFLMAFAGAAAVTRFTTVLTMPGDIVPPGQVGAATGFMFSTGYLGAVFGPLVSGHLLDITGRYEPMFFVLIGVSLATAIVGFFMPETGPGAHRITGTCQKFK